ncbi:MAG: UDP-4-amino-4,6-dideoxy-N-acetyl-beta-L-altrosamine transaminase [Sarcina sp.]
MSVEELAINGGEPVRHNFLSYGRQTIDEDDINAVVQVLKSDYLTTGPKVLEFEEKMACYVGAKYALAVSNGTAALHLACLAAGIKEGDEVLTTAITFVASANCILYCGAKPIFVDIDVDTYNMNIWDLKRKITNKTKAIIPVDLGGSASDLDEIMEIAKKNNLIVIEDAAHALGTKYKGKLIGGIAHITTFSFHPVKTITTGEGGMITTNNKEIYNKVSMLRTHGITRKKEEFKNKTNANWYYEQQLLGFNYRISDIHCALGISQLNKLNKFIELRKKIVEIYNKKLKNIPEVIIKKEENFSDTTVHIYVIRIDLDKVNCKRDDIFKALLLENIGVNLHYIPVYLHPYYKALGYGEGLCPNAEYVYKSMLTLPLYPTMTEEDIDTVVIALEKIFKFYRKH